MLICGDAGIGRQASLRCLCQYWRVGSSPISRTSVKDIRFSSVLYFYISANQRITIIKNSHAGIARNLRFRGRGNLFPRADKASPRCPSQYWRVGSSPISRTSVKDIRFSSVLYFYISANQRITIIKNSHAGIARNLRFRGRGNLFPRADKASPRCPSQYWRVGSSPISRTSVKDIRFSSVLYFCFSENLHIAVC